MTLQLNWDEKVYKLLQGTPRQQADARWKMGYRTGIRTEQARILAALSDINLLYWDKDSNVWLNTYTGKPVYGLDWRETNGDD